MWFSDQEEIGKKKCLLVMGPTSVETLRRCAIPEIEARVHIHRKNGLKKRKV